MTICSRIITVSALYFVVLGISGSTPGLGAFGPPTTTPSTYEVTKASGGSIRTVLSENIVLDKGSTLNREWIAIKQANLPAKLKGTPGVSTIYSGRSEHYEYSADYEVDFAEPVVAIEVRFITFNVWGERVNSLVATDVEDYAPGTQKLSATWNLYSENEASEYYASIAYVSRVRTKDGRVLTADIQPVLDEAHRFNAKFAESDLDPKKPTK